MPSLAIIGTGKRVGKTAVTGYVARLTSRTRRVVVVAMGRGGPPEPEVIRVPPTVETLLALSDAGRHAASDHLETAALAGVDTVGCRRCGGGLAGAVAVSNVLEGARLAATLQPDLVLFDGSGAACRRSPPGGACSSSARHQDVAVATGYLNAYRALIADLVVVTMAEEETRHAELAAALRHVTRPGVPVIRSDACGRCPPSAIAGERVAFFGTAPAVAQRRIATVLADRYGAHVVHVSGALADRARLREELADARRGDVRRRAQGRGGRRRRGRGAAAWRPHRARCERGRAASRRAGPRRRAGAPRCGGDCRCREVLA